MKYCVHLQEYNAVKKKKFNTEFKIWKFYKTHLTPTFSSDSLKLWIMNLL
jgi:hypothetical protein